MSKKTRRHHTPDQKINLLRRHHLDKVPVSEVCEGAELQPSVFYGWQRHLFDHGAAAFGESRKRVETSREQELLAENERLKARLARKDEVIAEVTEELVRTKKLLGSPEGPLGSPRRARPGRRLRAPSGREDRGADRELRGLAGHRPRQVL